MLIYVIFSDWTAIGSAMAGIVLFLICSFVGVKFYLWVIEWLTGKILKY